MNKQGGIGRRLWRAFTLQAIFISITAVLSVLAAGPVDQRGADQTSAD